MSRTDYNALKLNTLGHITNANEPFRHALAIARALQAFLEDVATDDPCPVEDGGVDPKRLKQATREATRLGDALAMMLPRD